MENFELSIQSRDPETILRLLDSRDKIIREAVGQVNENLPTGMYTLQWIINGILKEKVIKHRNGPSQIFTDLPENYSSALINGYTSSRDYYTDPAKQYSKSVTGDIGNNDIGESSFFLFIRFASSDHCQKFLNGRENIFEGFQLLNSDLKKISWLSSPEISRQHLSLGWGAICLKLNPGLYFLHFSNGVKNRLIPFHLIKGWQTQVFLMMHNTPMFETLKILMADIKVGFDPYDESNRELDRALLKLQNRNYSLPENVSHMLAYGKWNNPLLGIIWCYIYLRDNRSDKDDLFKEILRNLQGPILNSKDIPDLKAIRVIKAVEDKDSIIHITISETPMFAVGFREVISASYNEPHLVPDGSQMSRLAPALCFDTAWTTFDATHIIYPDSPAKIVIEAMLNKKSMDITQVVTRKLTQQNVSARWNNIRRDFFSELTRVFTTTDTKNDQVDEIAKILVTMSRKVDRIDSWEIISLISVVNQLLYQVSYEDIKLEDVAKQVGLPPATIRDLAKSTVDINRYAYLINTMSSKLHTPINNLVVDVLKKLSGNDRII